MQQQFNDKSVLQKTFNLVLFKLQMDYR